MKPRHREHRWRQLDRWRHDCEPAEQPTKEGNQSDERQQDPVAEDDATKRVQAKVDAYDVVEVELLLVVLCEKVVWRSLPEDTLPPRDLFHRDEHAEQRNAHQEPREGASCPTLAPSCNREDAARDEEAPERSPFERLVFLDASIEGVRMSCLEPGECAEKPEEDQVGK